MANLLSADNRVPIIAVPVRRVSPACDYPMRPKVGGLFVVRRYAGASPNVGERFLDEPTATARFTPPI